MADSDPQDQLSISTLVNEQDILACRPNERCCHGLGRRKSGFCHQNVARGEIDPVSPKWPISLPENSMLLAPTDEPNMTFEMCAFVTETQVVSAP